MEYGVYVGCPLCPLYSLLDNKIPQQLKINVSYNLVPTEAGEREKGGGGWGKGSSGVSGGWVVPWFCSSTLISA